MSLAAAVTPGGLELDYVDGVTEIDEKALPPILPSENEVQDGEKRAWRAHMNAIRTIVEQNISSALIFEGDIDWDMRIKSQMQDFAKASRLLLQPGREDDVFNIRESAVPPQAHDGASPFGNINSWDILWLGHCGTQFVEDEKKGMLHTGRAIIPDDETVPALQHFDKEFGSNEIVQEYPSHTRVVHRERMGVCSLAYAISQAGARRFLYELGVRKIGAAMDIMIREMCDGWAERPVHNCLIVQPQLFQHHRPVGSRSGFSEVQRPGSGYNKVAFTKNIRWSTRLNFRKLVDGETDYIDQYPDDEPRKTFG
jgi:hypothetical protein